MLIINGLHTLIGRAKCVFFVTDQRLLTKNLCKNRQMRFRSTVEWTTHLVSNAPFRFHTRKTSLQTPRRHYRWKKGLNFRLISTCLIFSKSSIAFCPLRLSSWTLSALDCINVCFTIENKSERERNSESESLWLEDRYVRAHCSQHPVSLWAFSVLSRNHPIVVRNLWERCSGCVSLSTWNDLPVFWCVFEWSLLSNSLN